MLVGVSASAVVQSLSAFSGLLDSPIASHRSQGPEPQQRPTRDGVSLPSHSEDRGESEARKAPRMQTLWRPSSSDKAVGQLGSTQRD